MGKKFNELPTPHLSFTALFITLESRLPDAGTTYENVCNVIEYSSNKYFCIMLVCFVSTYTFITHTCQCNNQITAIHDNISHTVS